jgi:hypothetical protein
LRAHDPCGRQARRHLAVAPRRRDAHPGHVAIFVRWKNKAKRTYVAMEETTWGHPTMHHVRTIGRGAAALR